MHLVSLHISYLLYQCTITFLGPRGLQGTHTDTLRPKNSQSITYTVKRGFFTFWAILAHSAAFRLFWAILIVFLNITSGS